MNHFNGFFFTASVGMSFYAGGVAKIGPSVRSNVIYLQNLDSFRLYLPVLLLTSPDASHEQRIYAHRVASDSCVANGSCGLYAHTPRHHALALLLAEHY